jgi:hypothetical protein
VNTVFWQVFLQARKQTVDCVWNRVSGWVSSLLACRPAWWRTCHNRVRSKEMFHGETRVVPF